jgi:UDP-GlcNAc:undecaprenyl-phosphate/decaprenyl-phosphate GlcNAc-1-phosphate transferase
MYLEIFFLFLTTYFGYKILAKYAHQINLIDLPNSRSSHNRPIVRGFGVVIFFSIGVTLLAFKSFLVIEHSNLLAAILVVGFLGLIDDFKSIAPFIKITTIVVVYMFLYAEGFVILNLGVYNGVELNLNLMTAIIFSTISIVTFTNAFNLIDGLDGLSALIAVIIFLAFLAIGLSNNDQFLTTIPVLFIVPLLVFLFYNWHPAKVFLGDSGSLMIGFVIALMAVRSLNYIEPIAILYITAVPIIDFLFVTIRRAKNSESIFKADRSHCHHILLSFFNGNVKKTVIMISAFQILFSLIGVIFVAKVIDSLVALTLFLLSFFIIYKLLKNLLLAKPNQKVS